MKYLIMMTQPARDDQEPEQPWTGEDVKASWEHMGQIYRELSEAGELLATEKLAGRRPPRWSAATACTRRW